MRASGEEPAITPLPPADARRGIGIGSKGEIRCAYCGAWIDLRYYFCTSCSVPYRDPDPGVYDDVAPFVPALETRLVTEARSSLNFFFILAIGLLTFAYLHVLAGEEKTGAILVIEELFLAGVTTIYAVTHWREISRFFQGIRFDWVLAASLPLLAALIVLNRVYHGFILELLGMGWEDTGLELLKRSLSPTFLFVSVCVLPAIFEEIGFRGVVQERLVFVAGFRMGIVLTSAFFVVLHFSPISAPYLFLLGMFLSWVRARTQSLYPPMVLHFLHNLAVLVLFHG